MRPNTKIIKDYVDERLEIWADWRLVRDSGVDGYPKAVSWLSLGLKTPGHSTVLISYNDDEMLDINDLIAQLPAVLNDLVLTYWLYVGSIELKAQYHSIAPETFSARLSIAYVHLIQWGL